MSKYELGGFSSTDKGLGSREYVAWHKLLDSIAAQGSLKKTAHLDYDSLGFVFTAARKNKDKGKNKDTGKKVEDTDLITKGITILKKFYALEFKGGAAVFTLKGFDHGDPNLHRDLSSKEFGGFGHVDIDSLDF